MFDNTSILELTWNIALNVEYRPITGVTILTNNLLAPAFQRNSIDGQGGTGIRV